MGGFGVEFVVKVYFVFFKFLFYLFFELFFWVVVFIINECFVNVEDNIF